MASAIDKFGYEKAKEVVLNTLRDLHRESPGQYFTINRICFEAEQMVHYEDEQKICHKKEEVIGSERIEVVRKTFSKRNLREMLERDISSKLDVVIVNDKFQFYYAYRLKRGERNKNGRK